jgi:opacity protein-like surface antigen
MKYKTQLCALLGVLLLAALLPMRSYAQDSTASQGISPITRSGSAAMMFSFGGPSTFVMSGPSANGSGDPRVFAGAGMKYYLSDRLAGRLLLNFGTATSGPDSAQTTSSTYGIGLAIEYHCHDLYAISPYFGGGVGINLINTSRPDTVPTVGGIIPKGGKITQATTTNPIKNSYTGFAVSALAGFDWFFAKSVALGTEFSLGFSSESQSHTSVGTTTNLPSTTMFGISTLGNIHLLVYF